ncbi:MAG TPA: chemotaxis protein CheR [Cyanothece sp. UBA12306]|nr:chemotaxis protein CheR [Cyanothece sp. UBA12306]
MPSNLDFTIKLKADFLKLISRQTGLEIRPQNQDNLENDILARTKRLKLQSLEEYYTLLTSSTQESDQEWKELISLLANNESYFFRDIGQFKLLRNTILPEIIERNKNKQTLRICSAGCSTGPEPYSLGILLKELIPNLEEWNLLILGIDLSQEALEIAKKARYSSWAFRKVDQEIQEKYFDKIRNEYQLKTDIKKMVTFKQCNLVQDKFWQANNDMGELDLIVCRNVFIYFNQSTISKILDKFYQILQPLGYLLTGHAEIASNNNSIKKFNSKLFSESVIYQKKPEDLSTKITSVEWEVKKIDDRLKNSKLSDSKPQLKIANSNTSKKLNNTKFTYESLPINKNDLVTEIEESREIEYIKVAQELIKQKYYSLAIRKLEQTLQEYPRNFNAKYLMAEVYANLGKYQEAIDYCNQALTLDSLSITPHYLLVQIAQEQGNLEEAKRLLKKIIYLEPYSVVAYLSLANIYKKTNNLKKYQKMQKNALKILNKLAPDTQIPELGNMTVKDTIIEIENLNN